MRSFLLGTEWREQLRKSIPQIILGAIIGTGALALAARGVDWRQVGAALLSTKPSMLMLALASVVVAVVLSVTRWWLLFAPGQRDVSWFALAGAILVGQAANIVVPARVGEIARIYLVGNRENVSKARVTATIVVERVTDLAVFALAIVLLLVNMTLPEWMARSGAVFVGTSAALLLTTALLTFWSEALLRFMGRIAARLPRHWGLRFIRVAEGAMAGFRALRDWRFGLMVWVLSGLILFCSIATNYIVFLAMGFRLSSVAALFLTVVLRIGIAPPSLPGKLGLFQYLVVLALAMFDIGRTAALSYSFALYAIAVLPVLVAGTIWAFAYRWSGVPLPGET